MSEGEIGMYYDADILLMNMKWEITKFLLILLFLKNIGCIPKANLLFKSNSYASAPPFGYNEMKVLWGGSSF